MFPPCARNERADRIFNSVTYQLCGLEEFMPLSGPQPPDLQDEENDSDFTQSPSWVSFWDLEGGKGMKFTEGREASSEFLLNLSLLS